MFKNRAMQVKMVKTPKDTVNNPTVVHTPIDFEQINKIALEQMRNVAIVGFAGVCALKVVTAACEIAINICPKN